MKEFLGTMYFTSEVDNEGKLRSVYQGKVVGFVVQRDNGSEYEVRKEFTMKSGTGVPLKKQDLETLAIGSKIAYLGDMVSKHTVQKVWPDHGDLWIRNTDTGKQTVAKYYELKRVE